MREQRAIEELEYDFKQVLTPRPGQPGAQGILAHKRILELEEHLDSMRRRLDALEGRGRWTARGGLFRIRPNIGALPRSTRARISRRRRGSAAAIFKAHGNVRLFSCFDGPPGVTRKLLQPGDRAGWTRQFLLVLVATTAFRLWLSVWLPFTGDEAYFYYWGKNYYQE
jgi:hypothetical protein